MSLFDLSGKVCIVTGGTSGIGRACVERMAEHGARVVITSRDAEAAEARARDLNDRYGADRALGLRFEIANRASGREFIDQTLQRWGRVDTLMCNAAHVLLGKLEALGDDMDLLDASLQTNVRNYAALTRLCVPVMRAQGGGSVIYVLSTAGFIGIPAFLPYGLAKATLAHLIRVLAVDLGPDNIRVNGICPGAIRTNTPIQRTGAAEMFVAKIPIARRGDPDEIAGTAVLLASPSGAYITGQTIVIDGGQLLKGGEGVTEGYEHALAFWAAEKEKGATGAQYSASELED